MTANKPTEAPKSSLERVLTRRPPPKTNGRHETPETMREIQAATAPELDGHGDGWNLNDAVQQFAHGGEDKAAMLKAVIENLRTALGVRSLSNLENNMQVAGLAALYVYAEHYDCPEAEQLADFLLQLMVSRKKIGAMGVEALENVIRMPLMQDEMERRRSENGFMHRMFGR